MSILQTVRTTTASKHNLMENLIGSDHLNDFSVEEYKLLLSTNYLFHSHLEHQITVFLSFLGEKEKEEEKNAKKEQINKLDFSNRIKGFTLENELKKLIPSTVFQELKSQENTVSFSGFENLLGWLYVAEGSMLGGKMIHKVLSQNKEISLITEFDFYKDYENKTPLLWKSLKELIEEKCSNENENEQFLDGAEKSYLCFEQSFYKAKNILQSK